MVGALRKRCCTECRWKPSRLLLRGSFSMAVAGFWLLCQQLEQQAGDMGNVVTRIFAIVRRGRRA